MRALALIAFAAMAAQAAPEATSAYVPFEKRVAQVVRLINPAYPKAAIERGQRGVVKVQGVVQPNGALAQVQITPDSDASAIFVPSVTASVPYWTFDPALGSDCRPSKQPIATEVRFTIEDGMPRVLATYSTDQFPVETPAVPPGLGEPDFRAVQRFTAYYPREWLSRGVDVNVYATLDVQPDGSVPTVLATAFPVVPYMPDPTPRERNALERYASANYSAFEDAAVRALSQWRYAPINRPVPRRVCYSLQFRAPA